MSSILFLLIFIMGPMHAMEADESGIPLLQSIEASENECCICMVDMAMDDPEYSVGFVIPCGCKYHKACIDEWIANRHKNQIEEVQCPQCKNIIEGVGICQSSNGAKKKNMVREPEVDVLRHRRRGGSDDGVVDLSVPAKTYQACFCTIV